MSNNNEIAELKNILVSFIKEQKDFNEKIDNKIDKTQYFLESTMAEYVKALFEEQKEIKEKIKIEFEYEIKALKIELIHQASELKYFKSILSKNGLII